MKLTSYMQIPKERYATLMTRYEKYLDALNDPSKDPVRVFDPLSQKQLDELELIRSVSKELQLKKEDDMLKAAQAAEEAKKAAEERAKEEAEKENKQEENIEEENKEEPTEEKKE